MEPAIQGEAAVRAYIRRQRANGLPISLPHLEHLTGFPPARLHRLIQALWPPAPGRGRRPASRTPDRKESV